MKRYWKHISLTALAVAMLMAIAAPALAGPAEDAAEHGLSVKSWCAVSGGGSGTFTFDTGNDTVVTGHVNDWYDSKISWSGNLSDVKMNQGWERVKAQLPVEVWGYVKGYGDVPADDPLNGVFSFDFTGVEPTELEGGDYILNESWYADGEWTIKVPSLPIEGHELGCFGYNFHTGDYGFNAYLNKWLSR